MPLDADNLLNDLAAPCQRALDIHLRRMLNEALNHGEQAFIDSHVNACPACQTLFASLQTPHEQVRDAAKMCQPAKGFAARTMQRIDQSAARTAAPEAAKPPALRVWTAPARTGIWRFRKIALAAASVCLALAGIYAAIVFTATPALAVSVKRGELAGKDGESATRLRQGQTYIARKQTVLELGQNARVKMEAGAEFRLKISASRLQPDIELSNGDLYARADGTGIPLGLSCRHFDTEVQGGDIFVAHEDAAVSRGIVIVFSGSALVSATNQSVVRLGEGQVFYSVGTESWSTADRLELREVPQLKARHAEAAQVAPPELRAQYEVNVSGYQRELAALRSQMAQNERRGAARQDLSDRVSRVEKYLQIHQRRLEALSATGGTPPPFDQIQRGLDGRTDGRDWL
jgi:hypothetical protein